MHDLQLVGFTTDRRGLIFRPRDGARAEASFVVPVTDELVELVTQLAGEGPGTVDEPVEPDVDADGAEPPAAPLDRPRSSMSVRDIQARLRAGEPLERIAAEAGVDEDWIERFAPPIRAEQRRIVERALERHLERSRSAPSAVPLRRAVGMALADKGIAYTVAAYEAAWTARLLGQDRWAVEFTYRHRGRDRTASFTYDVAEDVLTTTDRAAAQLGYVAPGTASEDAGAAVDGIVGDPSATASPVASAADAEPSSTRRSGAAATKKTATKKTATKKKPPVKRTAPKKKTAAKRTATKRTASKKAATKKAATKKKPPVRRAATKPKVATKQAVAKQTAGQHPVAPKEPVAEEAPAKEQLVVRTAAQETSPPPQARRSSDEPSRPSSTRPLRDPDRHVPAAPSAVAARPGDVSMADVPLAGDGQAPRPNGRATERPPGTDEGAPSPARDEADPISARRARAAQRTTSTVQFRTGSAAPVRTAAETSGARTDTGSRVDGADRTRPERGDANGAARPSTRRRRQLRAR